jgi:hypothetical protein
MKDIYYVKRGREGYEPFWGIYYRLGTGAVKALQNTLNAIQSVL